METDPFPTRVESPQSSFQPTYEGWKLRDAANWVTAHQLVFSLPMRDGNKRAREIVEAYLAGFQPTYEGWKPGEEGRILWRELSFQPTYEGWKLFLGIIYNPVMVEFSAYL